MGLVTSKSVSQLLSHLIQEYIGPWESLKSLSRKQTFLGRAADPLKIRLAGETTHKPPDLFGP